MRTRITLKELVVVSRPFWWINTAAGFIASYWLLNDHLGVLFAIGVLYFAFAYNLLMYGVNDIYDYESDIKNPRKIAAGIEGSVMSKKKHPSLWFWMLCINIPLLVYLYLQGTTTANLWLTLMIFMVFAYSQKGLRWKEIPLLDSFTSSFHYTSPFIYGGLLAGAGELYIPAFITYFIWVMGNHAFGAIQDITPDRQAGISSIATKLGAAKTIIFVLLAYVVAALLPVVFYGLYGAVVAILLSPYVLIVAQTFRDRENDEAPSFRVGWKRFLYVNYAVGFSFTLILLYAKYL